MGSNRRGLTYWLVVDKLRPLLAKLAVLHLARPHPFVIHAWLRLAAEADDLEETRRSLNEVLRLDPENEAASVALLLLDRLGLNRLRAFVGSGFAIGGSSLALSRMQMS